jgi:hypothetical protein
MLKPSASNLIIGGIWVAFIVSVAFSSSPAAQSVPMPLSNGMALILLIMPIAFFGAMAFVGPAKSPFSLPPKFTSFISARCGEHAWESFLVRLKPLLLFGVTCLLGGAIGLWRTYQEGGPFEAYVFSGFWVSSAFAFAIAHTILYLRKAEGIYPSYLHGEISLVRPVEKLPLKQALRAYWWTLIGISALPAIMVVGQVLPFEFIIVLFFGVCFTAMWPVISGRAPYMFWLVAMGLYLMGGMVAAVVARLIRS